MGRYQSLLIRPDGEGVPFDHRPKVACGAEESEQLPVEGWPIYLVFFELRAVESQRLPSVGAELFEDRA